MRLLNTSLFASKSSATINSSSFTKATYQVAKATLPHSFCPVWSVSISHGEMFRNMDKMSPGYRQKAPSISVSISIFNVEHKRTFTVSYSCRFLHLSYPVHCHSSESGNYLFWLLVFPMQTNCSRAFLKLSCDQLFPEISAQLFDATSQSDCYVHILFVQWRKKKTVQTIQV